VIYRVLYWLSHDPQALTELLCWLVLVVLSGLAFRHDMDRRP
jgi:hypothetical protein